MAHFCFGFFHKSYMRVQDVISIAYFKILTCGVVKHSKSQYLYEVQNQV